MDTPIVIDGPVSEVRAVHGMHIADGPRQGYFALCAKDKSAKKGWRQKMHSMGALETAAKAVGSSPDAYISQASFAYRARSVAALQSLSCVFVDLDCHRELGVEQEDFIGLVHERLDNLGLELPTYTVGSGNGLHLKWILRESVQATNLDVWKSVERLLTDVLSDLSADKNARDAARVLRVLHSTNSTAVERGRGGRVDILHQSGTLHSLDGLAGALQYIDIAGLQTGHTPAARRAIERRTRVLTERVRVASRASDLDLLEHFAQTREPLMAGALTRLNWQRFLDLRTLAVLRGGFLDGERDLFLFWMAVHLSLARVLNATNFDAELHELARAFPVCGDFRPLEDGSMESLRSKVMAHLAGKNGVDAQEPRRRSTVYTANNQTLIDRFSITDSEMAHLTTILSGAERERRKARDPRTQRIRDMVAGAGKDFTRDAGATVAKLAAAAGASRARLYRDCPAEIQRLGDARNSARQAIQERVRALAAQGMSVRAIAAQTGSPASTVGRWLQERPAASAAPVTSVTSARDGESTQRHTCDARHEPLAQCRGAAEPVVDVAKIRALQMEQRERLAGWAREQTMRSTRDSSEVIAHYRQMILAQRQQREQANAARDSEQEGGG